ncbi:MAG: hypothetical protein KGL39_30000, partial [Patescibacteria group bacterium]|nr:hypothetical protein [Patescibacteria group bacterium]
RDLISLWQKSSTRKAFSTLDARRTALIKAMDRQPEARFAPRMAELVQDRLVATLDGKEVDEDDLELVAYQVANGVWKGETFAQIITPKEMTKITNSALAELRRERDAGFNPRFVYSTTSREIPRIGAAQAGDRIVESRSSKSRARYNPSAVYDPIIGLTRKETEDLHEHVVTEMFYGEQGIESRWGTSFDDAMKEAMQLVRAPEGEDPGMLRHRLNEWFDRQYAHVDPRAYVSRKGAQATGASPDKGFYVPRPVKDALDANFKVIVGPKSAPGKIYAGGTQLFRFTLLNFSPRYQVHIWAGGAALYLMQAPGGVLSMAIDLPAALGMMVHSSEGWLKAGSEPGHIMAPVLQWLKSRAELRGETRMPLAISHGVAEADPQDVELLKAYNFTKGRKLGQWMSTLMERRGLNAGTELANFGANTLRSLAYFTGKRVAGGDAEAGVQFALKVFADMDGMSPLERSIIRYVMPFYGWTKHILQYVAHYPIDHPWRAAILSQLINQEWQDWNTGIPQSMMYLFELGGIDGSGNATVLDIRQLDPLRSVSDVFTMAGFLSSLNPAIQNVVLPALGVDPTTGGPEQLYPTMTVDQFYGTEQPAPRNPLGVAESGIAGYVPQATAVETVLGLTSYARWAKQNDPAAYRNQIYGALNFPWVPYKVNMYQVVATQQEHDYNVARDAATAALADPNPNSPTWKSLMGYSYVPYQGWYVQPAALRQWAFDQVIQAGYWNGQVATMAPSSIVVPPQAPNI